MSKILITSGLLYANGKIHFGHIAGAYLSADIYARFERMQGNEVMFVSGSDEYGVAITLSAEKAGRTPREHVDHFHTANKLTFEQLHISFDNYSRTTWEGHAKHVLQYFEDLKKNGYVEERETEQLYSEQEGRFLADRYVVGTCPHCGFAKARGDECTNCGASYEATDLSDPRSKATGSPLARRKTSHWFLLLDKLQPKLDDWIAGKKWKPGVLNFAKRYIENPRPRAITRDAEWGVPVSPGKVFYVWFEACIGYLSATEEAFPDTWRDFWCDPDTRLVQFVGKDNIFFHGVFFPAMTLGQDQPYKTVDELPANEFLTLEGKQFSKSEGWFIDIDDFLASYTADQIRYTLAANAPETHDSEFTWHDFQARCNSELLGKFGNLVNRTLVFLNRKMEGRIPPLGEGDFEFLDEVRRLADETRQAYAAFSPRRAVVHIMELAALGNTFFDHRAPWKAPDATHRATTLACCLECLKALAVIAAPIIPDAASKLWAMLGLTDLSNWDAALAAPLPSTLPEPHILFQKIEDDQIDAEIAKLGPDPFKGEPVNG
jgi:methionyl-tRNA synthetase